MYAIASEHAIHMQGYDESSYN